MRIVNSFFICFDLEGPLSPQDNAYELMKLFPGGGRLFESISRYDDLLTLEQREGYEPGDTLALIVPFLLLHGIGEEDIHRLSLKASLTPGAPELVSTLRSAGWDVFCISTSYEQYALSITRRLGLQPQNVAATPFPVRQLQEALGRGEKELIGGVEKDMAALPATDDQGLKERLDRFFFQEMPSTGLRAVFQRVKPVGGIRKVKALERFAALHRQPLSNWVVVGDSITDFKMLGTVNGSGGLAVAFNANEYALPHATLGLAARRIDALWPVLEAWGKGGREAVKGFVAGARREGNKVQGYFSWFLDKGAVEEALPVHKEMRLLIRGEASKLG